LLDPSIAISIPAESSVRVPARRTSDAHIPTAGRASAGLDQSFQPSWICHSIVVQRRDVGSIGRADSLVDRRAKSTLRSFEMTRTRAVTGVRVHAVCTVYTMPPAVIDDDHFKPVERLSFE